MKRRANGYPRDRTRLPRRNWVEALVDALEKDEQSLWGLIIYRTTYSDEEGWTQFLRELEEETRDEFTRYNGLEELEQKANTVMDDASQFDGMTSLQVREHCKQWISENFEREQGKPPADAIYPYGSAPRYRYAIQVDEETLKSMTSSNFNSKGWVRLIDLEWFEDRWDGDDVYEPIEGMTQEDVGWAQIHWYDFVCESYVNLYNINYWPSHYRRPPQII